MKINNTSSEFDEQEVVQKSGLKKIVGADFEY